MKQSMDYQDLKKKIIQDPYLLRYVEDDSPLKNDMLFIQEIIQERQSYDVMRYLSREFFTMELIDWIVKAVEENPYIFYDKGDLLYQIPHDSILYSIVWNMIISKDGLALQYIPLSERSLSLCIKAILQDVDSSAFVPAPIQQEPEYEHCFEFLLRYLRWMKI